MLKGIPGILSPDLLKILREMGHGDEIAIVDGNYPAANHAQRLVRLDGHGACEVLEAVMKLFPLDQYVERPTAIMEVVPGDPVKPVIWERFAKILERTSGTGTDFEKIERFAFYERCKQAYAIIATGESAQYANIILKKGVIAEGK